VLHVVCLYAEPCTRWPSMLVLNDPGRWFGETIMIMATPWKKLELRVIWKFEGVPDLLGTFAMLAKSPNVEMRGCKDADEWAEPQLVQT
jgi:hypothetical protein